MATTIIDVARTAQVSIGTASNALSGRRPVREATKQRVQAAADQLGYRPNLVARSLIQRRTGTIGLVVPDVANPYFAELTRGVERRISEARCGVLLADARNDPEVEAEALETLLDRRVDGVVLVPVRYDAVQALRLAEIDVPVVLTDRTLPGWQGDAITADHAQSMRLAVDHLVGLGHQHIALLSGDQTTSTGRERAAATRRRLARHGLTPRSEHPSPFSLDAGAEAAREVLADRQATAIVATADLLALGAIETLQAAKVSVPRQMSVVGVDGIVYGRLSSPALTTIAQPSEELGSLAADRLLARLAGGEPQGRCRRRGELVIRASTAPPPRAGRR